MNMFTRDFINPRQNLPADDPLGIEAWSLSRGLEPHVGLALVSCVIAGVTGPMRSVQMPSPGSPGAGCNLIAREEDGLVSMTVSELIEPLCQLQKGLVLKGREFTTKELADAMYDPGIRVRNSDYLAKLRDPEGKDPDYSDIPIETELNRHSQISHRSVLFDGLVRPHFILTGSCRGHIAKVLAGCHSGMAFAGGLVEALPVQTGPRNRRISEIVEGFRGVTIDRLGVGGQNVSAVETVKLSGLLRFPENDFRWIIDNRKDLPAVAIPISSVYDDGSSKEAVADENRASGFIELFHRVARNALASRRAHHWLHMKFSGDQTVTDFLRLQREFTREVCSSRGHVAIHAAASLPAQMAWALLLLAGRNNLDPYISTNVFSAARRLHSDTQKVFMEQDVAALAKRRLAVARKLVARVTTIGPCKRRDLVRGLDQQALSLHEPVIRLLINHGILMEAAAGMLSVGRVPLKSLAEIKLIDASNAP